MGGQLNSQHSNQISLFSESYSSNTFPPYSQHAETINNPYEIPPAFSGNFWNRFYLDASGIEAIPMVFVYRSIAMFNMSASLGFKPSDSWGFGIGWNLGSEFYFGDEGGALYTGICFQTRWSNEKFTASLDIGKVQYFDQVFEYYLPITGIDYNGVNGPFFQLKGSYRFWKIFTTGICVHRCPSTNWKISYEQDPPKLTTYNGWFGLSAFLGIRLN